MLALASISFVLADTLIPLTTVVIACVIAFGVGALLAFLLVTPAKVAADNRVRNHVRGERNLDAHIRDLQKQNDQLHENNTSLVAERDHLRSQLDALRQHDASAIAASAAGPNGRPEAPAVQSQQIRTAPAYTSSEPLSAAPQTAASREQGITTPGADMTREPAHAAPEDGSRRQESVGERIKDFFTGNRDDQTLREDQAQRQAQDQHESQNAQEPNAPA